MSRQTLIGEKPDATEAEAWLAPMLRCGEHYGVVGVEEELARAGLCTVAAAEVYKRARCERSCPRLVGL